MLQPSRHEKQYVRICKPQIACQHFCILSEEAMLYNMWHAEQEMCFTERQLLKVTLDECKKQKKSAIGTVDGSNKAKTLIQEYPSSVPFETKSQQLLL